MDSEHEIKRAVIKAMTEAATKQDENFRGRYPVRMATISIRLKLELDGIETTSKELRGILMQMQGDGLVRKSEYHSRRGSAVWELIR